jgi:hypothetical protein
LEFGKQQICMKDRIKKEYQILCGPKSYSKMLAVAYQKRADAKLPVEAEKCCREALDAFDRQAMAWKKSLARLLVQLDIENFETMENMVADSESYVAAAVVAAVAVRMPRVLAKGKAKVAQGLRRVHKRSIRKQVLAGETLEEALTRMFFPVRMVSRFYIRRRIELKKYGLTWNCHGCIWADAGGCVSAKAGTASAKPHSEQCRNRIVALMKRDRDDTVKVAGSYRKMQKMPKVKNEPVLYALMSMGTGRASSSSAGPVAASTPVSSAAGTRAIASTSMHFESHARLFGVDAFAFGIGS